MGERMVRTETKKKKPTGTGKRKPAEAGKEKAAKVNEFADGFIDEGAQVTMHVAEGTLHGDIDSKNR